MAGRSHQFYITSRQWLVGLICLACFVMVTIIALAMASTPTVRTVSNSPPTVVFPVAPTAPSTAQEDAADRDMRTHEQDYCQCGNK